MRSRRRRLTVEKGHFWTSGDQLRSAFHSVEKPMIALYSYPELFGVADNNGNGLKVFAFLRFTGVLFTQEHIFDASADAGCQRNCLSARW